MWPQAVRKGESVLHEDRAGAAAARVILRPGRRGLIAGLLVVVLVALATVVPAPFSMDDQYVLARAAAPEPGTFLWAWNIDAPSELKGAWYDGVTLQRRYVRLLPSAVMAMEVRLFGANSTALHAVSLAFHLLAVVLLFELLSSCIGQELPAALGAGLFGIHPAAVEVVSSAASLPLIITAVCLLVAALALRNFRRHGGPRALGVFALSTVAALTSYEAAVLAPLVVVAADFVGARRNGARGSRLFGPSVAVLAATSVTAILSWSNRLGATHPDTSYSPTLSEFLFVARTDLENYLLKTIGILNPFDLEEYWPHNALGSLGVAAILIVGLALLVPLLRRHRAARFGALIYVALLLPPYLVRATVSLLNFPTVRQIYLPMLGAALVLAAALRVTRKNRALIATALLVPAVVLMDGTLARNGLVGTSVHMERMRRVPRIVEEALRDMQRERPIILVGSFADPDNGCDFGLPLIDPHLRGWALVPPAAGGELPVVRRVDDHSFDAEASGGFRIPLQTVVPERAGPTDELWASVRLTRHPAPLVAQGRQSLGGAEVEVLDRDASAIRALRFTLQRPLDDFVFLWVRGCEQASALSGTALPE